MARRSLLVLLLPLAFVLMGNGGTQEPQEPWRIRFLEAAVVSGPNVLLGEVAVPVGDMPRERWKELASRELWPSPGQEGKAVNMTRPKLQEAVMRSMKDLAPFCLFPGSLALQRGGAVLGKEDVQRAAVAQLTPALAVLPGESSLRDFRIPQYIFLSHAGQNVEVEPQKRIAPGRMNFRFLVRELDGAVVQRISASVFVDSWMQAPCAAVSLNKDDILEPSRISFIRVNLAHQRGEIWDGRGGPWRVMRPIGVQQVIHQADLGHIPTVKKGATVALVFEGRGIRLSAPGEALSDGVTGESIAVRNINSRKQVYGVVRDGVTVVVNPSPGGGFRADAVQAPFPGGS